MPSDDFTAATSLARLLRKAGTSRVDAASRIEQHYDLTDAEVRSILVRFWGRGMNGTDDDEWVSYTFGEMPPYAVFARQVEASDLDADSYPMELVNGDEISAVDLVLPQLPEDSYATDWTELYTLNIEWI